jgi:hypothetical protein
VSRLRSGVLKIATWPAVPPATWRACCATVCKTLTVVTRDYTLSEGLNSFSSSPLVNCSIESKGLNMISAYIYGRVPLYSQAEAVALSAVVDAIKDGNQLEHGDSAFLLSLVARLKFGPHDELVEDDAPEASSPS